MALSAAELLQLQQSLTQLAKASSNIAMFATQLGSVQNANIQSTQNETKYRRTVIDDYDSLSKALKNQTKQYRDALKYANGYTSALSASKERQSAVADELEKLQEAISAVGVATLQQVTDQTRLTRELDLLTDQIDKANENLSKSSQVSSAVIDLIQSSKEAARYQTEYEKDFYGRQLAAEVKSSLENVTNQIGGKFGDQLLRMTDVAQIANFAAAQDAAIHAIIENNGKLDDSNADLIQQYVDLGKSLGYTSSEFDFLAAHLGVRTTGTSINISQSSLDSLTTAQKTIADAIVDSNEKISKTFDKDISSFSSQVKQYMYQNRNDFDRLIDDLADINARHGSLTTGEGGKEAADVLHSAVGKLGSEIIPKLGAAIKIMANFYTGEFDALTNFVQTDRIAALRLNMTEDQYRQAREESKEIWNLSAESGQEQLDSFLTSRRRSLEAVYGSEPMQRDKMGTAYYNLTQLFGTSTKEVDGMIDEMGKLSLVSRMSSTELGNLSSKLTYSNDNMRVMNTLDDKGRQLRVKEIQSTVKMVSSMGLAGEAAEKYAEALLAIPVEPPEVSDIISQYGTMQQLVATMSNLASALNMKPALTYEQGVEYGQLLASKQQGFILSAEEDARLSSYNEMVANFMNQAAAEKQRLGQTMSLDERTFSLLNIQNLQTLIAKATEGAGIKPMVDPIRDQTVAMEKYNNTQNRLITSVDELKNVMDRQAKEAEKRAEGIKTAKEVTGVFNEGKRMFDAAQGNMYVDLTKTLGTGAILSAIARTALPALLPEIIVPLLTGGALIAGVAALGVAGYATYKAVTAPSESKETEKAAEAPKPQTSGPNAQVVTADADFANSSLSIMLKEHFNSVEKQNNMIADFLRQLTNNSNDLGKGFKEWHDLYETVHPISTIKDDEKKGKSTDQTVPAKH